MFARFISFVFGLILIISFYPTQSFSHPGRTASDGCHYCRTRCDYWGVPWNERHCHGGLKQEEVKNISKWDRSSSQIYGISAIGTLNHSGGTDAYGCHVDHSTGIYHCH